MRDVDFWREVLAYDESDARWQVALETQRGKFVPRSERIAAQHTADSISLTRMRQRAAYMLPVGAITVVDTLSGQTGHGRIVVFVPRAVQGPIYLLFRQKLAQRLDREVFLRCELPENGVAVGLRSFAEVLGLGLSVDGDGPLRDAAATANWSCQVQQ